MAKKKAPAKSVVPVYGDELAAKALIASALLQAKVIDLVGVPSGEHITRQYRASRPTAQPFEPYIEVVGRLGPASVTSRFPSAPLRGRSVRHTQREAASSPIPKAPILTARGMRRPGSVARRLG